MPLMKTANPALGENTFRGYSGGGIPTYVDAASRMTLSGTVNKTGILLVCAIFTSLPYCKDSILYRRCTNLVRRHFPFE